MTRVLVCGGRDYGEMPRGLSPHSPEWERARQLTWEERNLLWSALDKLKARPTAILHGGARGADRLADVWARDRCVPVERYPAEWIKHGRAAGPIRNQRMLDEGRPDLVVAFPGGAGTADMVRRARGAGVEVMEIADA